MQVRDYMVLSTWQSSILSLHWLMSGSIQSRIIYWASSEYLFIGAALASEKNLLPLEPAVITSK